MAYCSRCGVEVEARATSCPLCDAPIQRLEPPGEEPPRYPEPAAGPPPRTRRRRRIRSIAWLVTTATLASAALTCLVADALPGDGLSWSPPTLAGIAVAWVFAGLVLFHARRPLAVIAGQAATTAAFLLVLDGLDGTLAWFVPLGLPIVGIVTAAAILTWLVAARTSGDPLLIAAAALATGAAACVGIDLLVSARLGAPAVGWSLIVLAAVAGPAVLLVYARLRLVRDPDVARILHS